MPVASPITTKTFEDTQAGELVCFPNGQLPHDLAFVVNHTEDGNATLALLRSNDAQFPSFHITTYGLDGECVSYGREWVFEPLPELGAISADLRERSGTWIVQGDVVAMRFAHSVRRGGGSATIDLRTFERAQTGRFFATAGPYWNLWAKEADMTNPRKAPLLAVLPEAQAA